MSKLHGDPGYRDGWCIHYRGITGSRGEEVTSCEAGIEYSSFRANVPEGQYITQPCFLDKGVSRPGALPCPHLRIPTADEIVAHEQWAVGRREHFIACIQAIPKTGDGGQVKCPKCEGQISWSRARSNKHVHARCSTPYCFSMMQ